MSDSTGSAAPSSGDEIPEFEELAADPEIAALLDFEPVVRKRRVAGGWTPEAQRQFVAYVAALGSRTRAAEAVDREVAGASKLCRTTGGESFSAACDAALDLFERRRDAAAAQNRGRAWGEPLRSRRNGRHGRSAYDDPPPGHVLNEYGAWEDEQSYERRAQEARDSIANKLTRVRRLYLLEISGSPAKRAAFEILTEFAVDWDKAALLEPQIDEPFRRLNAREPDIILAAEAGWMGDVAHGRNRWVERKAELRQEMDAYHAKHGLPPIDWDAEEGWDED